MCSHPTDVFTPADLLTMAGTHIDMPSHFISSELLSGNTAEKLDLNLLVGPATVMELPPGSNITGGSNEETLSSKVQCLPVRTVILSLPSPISSPTAAALELLNIPSHVERLILKTDSTSK